MTDKPRSALVPALLLLLAGCAGDTPEQRLRDTIAAMAEAVEDKQPKAFIAHVTEDFRGDRGSFDRQSLRAMLTAQMMRRESLGVTVASLDVTMHGERATVRADVLLTGAEGAIPDSFDHLDIESGWKLVDGEWQCYVAELK